MPTPRGRKLLWRIARIIGIFIGCYGGWVVAGAMNNHRADLPRQIPSTQTQATRP